MPFRPPPDPFLRDVVSLAGLDPDKVRDDAKIDIELLVDDATATLTCTVYLDPHEVTRLAQKYGRWPGGSVAAPPICNGSSTCTAAPHIHGCYADTDGSSCDDPSDHHRCTLSSDCDPATCPAHPDWTKVRQDPHATDYPEVL